MAKKKSKAGKAEANLIKELLSFNKIKKGLKKESETLKKEIQTKSLSYIMAGFGVVTGLAWNEAIKALIAYWFPLEDKGSLLAQFGYALLLTLIVVFLGVYLSRLLAVED